MPTTTLKLDVEFDPDLTDPEGLASAMDRLMETALSTPGILEEYGNPRLGEFLVMSTTDESHSKPGPTIVVEISGGALQEAFTSDPLVQLLFVDWDTEGATPGDSTEIVEVIDGNGRSRRALASVFPTNSIDRLKGTDTSRVLEAAGLAPQATPSNEVKIRRWVLYDPANDSLLTTGVYASYEEAADEVSRIDDVLVLSLQYHEVHA